jgi:CHAD domain-containing protein
MEMETAITVEPSPPNQNATSPHAQEKLVPKTLAETILIQLRTLQAYHAVVVDSGDIESVHKMRVTTRRLQASLDLLQFGNYKAEIKKLKNRLRKWRRKLSRVRNYDVFLILLESEAQKQGAIRRSLSSLKSELQNRRDHHAQTVLSQLRRIDLVKFANTLGLTLEEKGTGEPVSIGEAQGAVAVDPARRPDAVSIKDKHLTDEKGIARRAAKRIEQRAGEFLALASQAQPTTHPEELHQLRIAAKRLRYLLEIAAEMGLGNSRSALEWLRSLQDRIGDWHDLESIENEILDIIAKRNFMKERLVDTGMILTATIHLQKKKKALVSRLFPVKVHRRVKSTSNRIARGFYRIASTKS